MTLYIFAMVVVLFASVFMGVRDNAEDKIIKTAISTTIVVGTCYLSVKGAILLKQFQQLEIGTGFVISLFTAIAIVIIGERIGNKVQKMD